MPNINDLKEKLKNDEEFKNKFLEIKSTKEAIEMAQKFGFNVKENEIENDPELSEDLLEAVAGGKGIDIDRKSEKVYVFGDDCEARVIKRSEYEKGGGI
ncbi:MAG: hypothetical protein RUMPE_01116 [Eubacteriales bacterium SKADARSKE-1]|nr:hypothetical protein [Eubacteriales bacterium SKADARSKE-1]